MALQGEIYFPKTILPPGQTTKHRIIIVSNSNLCSNAKIQFLMTAIVRSADGVRAIPGHSILIPSGTIQNLPYDSLIETHQLFAVSPKELSANSCVGRLIGLLLNDVLAGCSRVFG